MQASSLMGIREGKGTMEGMDLTLHEQYIPVPDLDKEVFPIGWC